MALNKKQLEELITTKKVQLEDTLDSANFTAGPVRDALRVVIPAMQDMYELISMVVDAMPEEQVVVNIQDTSVPFHTHFVDPRGATNTGGPQ